MGHFPGTQPWPVVCHCPTVRAAAEPLGCDRAAESNFRVSPTGLGWNELWKPPKHALYLSDRRIQMRFGRYALTAFLQSFSHGNTSGKPAWHACPSQEKAAQGALLCWAGDCSEFPHCLYLESWQGYQHRLPQPHVLPSSCCGFPFPPWIFYVNIAVACESSRFCVSTASHSLSQRNEPKGHFTP